MNKKHWLSSIVCLGLSLSFSFQSAAVAKIGHYQNVPAHFARLKSESLHSAKLPQNRLLELRHKGATKGYHFELPLAEQTLAFDVARVSLNPNGDISFSHKLSQNKQTLHVLYTQGDGVGIGEVLGAGKHLYFEQYGNVVYVTDIAKSGLLPGLYENDVLGDMTGLSTKMTTGYRQKMAPVVVDVMLLYTQNIRDTFPGAMTETLLNQLVMKANQAFVDSDINMQLRLVHSEFVDYQQPSDLTAISDLGFAMEPANSEAADPSLREVARLRNEVAADIVAMIRTHDLNERDVCGIARFPDASSDILINISNVGLSGGSNCINTFTHEIGHNFGAGHQAVDGQSVGALSFSGALIQPGKFNTMMSSIGTGDINRNFKLNLFSNPNKQCGGVICGDVNVADNARTINNFAATNAALREAVSSVEVVLPELSNPDRDGDDVIDSLDAFPFNGSETLDTDLDGLGDNSDVFPTDGSESLDTDNDGVGNNSDPDDDNDGVADNIDALPLDPADSVDADGDGFGENNDALDNNFQEFEDFDQDGSGNKQDTDDDNDGVEDFSEPSVLVNSELWIASAGNDSILRYDAQNGNFIEKVLEVESGGFSFRTDLVRSESQQLLFIAFSDVYEFDRQSMQISKVVDRRQLQSNFPVHLSFDRQQNLIVNNGLGPSVIEAFARTSAGNNAAYSMSSDAVYRDMLLADDTTLLVLSRSTNQILSYDLGNNSAPPQSFVSEGLDKPEHMAMDRQSNLFVTNAGNNNISRFDSAGTFLGEFISAGAGGLSTPGCITVGPDEALYVCSTDTNQILKFDGDSGAFIDEFAGPDDGLLAPVGLVFLGKQLDELPFDDAHDSDEDGINNNQDAFPLDETETTDTDQDGTGNNADMDDDNDGMPDTFEIDNGFDPLNAADANEDADNDGSTNLAEFNAGTDPNSASSVPITPEPTPPVDTSGGGGSMAFLLLGWVLLLGRRPAIN